MGKKEGAPTQERESTEHSAAGSAPAPKLRLAIADMDGESQEGKKKKKNNEMGLPLMRKHRAMPAFDLESIHKAFLARIFKTKIEISSSMIYKIALERWGRTLYNKKQKSSLLICHWPGEHGSQER